ncbi:ead/Ea22-like family protein [Enterobacter hormaechei]|uniref:ead/Ea22-like family protein n=1 Tax=Enterobacter hormaechei TaxID=158836 RepID=UPI000F834898|nr:ead/Ea22-like family protein [Enterobacter hormaechei]RTO81525.1 ead/Ea22-like family protein [Enterobacter hormaechei]
MSNIDKQALREAAEKATPGEWKRMMRNSDELMTTFHGIAIGNVFVELTTGKRDIFDAEFIAASNPATVLALLDELEAAEKRISELEAREVKLPNPHAHLIWIQAGHAPDDYWDDVAVSHSEKDKCCDGSDRYPVYAVWEIKEALSAIGINVTAAGKGE